tara:strand:+ start:266 stop:550 length:285 start_codon:yes stop_codon:yes gene_type:complete
MVEVEGCNRYLVVDIIEDAEEEQNSLVLLPDEYEQPKGMYAIGKVKKSATWNDLEWIRGQLIAFPRSVVQEITFRGETIYLVQENYIICTLGDN